MRLSYLIPNVVDAGGGGGMFAEGVWWCAEYADCSLVSISTVLDTFSLAPTKSIGAVSMLAEVSVVLSEETKDYISAHKHYFCNIMQMFLPIRRSF